MNTTALLRILLVLCLGACLSLVIPDGDARATAASQPATQAPPSLTPDQAWELLTMLNNPARRAALTATLNNLAKAVATKPASAPAPAGLAPDSLGADVLTSVSKLGTGLAAQAEDFGKALQDFRYVGGWLTAITGNAARRNEVMDALLRLAMVLGVALIAAFVLNRLVRAPISALARAAGGRQPPPVPPVEQNGDVPSEAEPTAVTEPIAGDEHRTRTRNKINFARMMHALKRLPFAVFHFGLELVPITGFALIGVLCEFIGFIPPGESLVVVQAAINAFVVGGVLIALNYTLFAPGRPALRLVLISDPAAARVSFWLRAMIMLGAWGFAILNVAGSLGLPDYSMSSSQKLLMFVEHTLLAVLILRSRSDVARRLQPPRRITGASRQSLRWLADNWWIIAIFFNYAFWLVWAAQVRNGYTRLWTFTLETAIVAVVARLLAVALLGGLERMFRIDPELADRYPWYARRAERYYPIVRRVVIVVVLTIASFVLLQLWGLQVFDWFRAGALGSRVVSALVGVLVALLIGAIVWEAANAALERHIEHLTREQTASAARLARVRTLMPILRIVLLIFIATVLTLTILSEIGVNIAPLLGGAGIVGVAIGFGSQKLVQDFITGIFLLLENTMQVGDWVTLAGLSGTVEQLSIRTIRLRAGDGSVHVIPFSSVTTVTNTNRGFGNAPVSVDIAPDEDPDRVADLLKAIATQMRAEPAYGSGMLSDLQYWGVDKVTTQTVTLVGQIVCTASARYGVQREFNRRMKKQFEELGIRLAQPSQIVRLIQVAQSSTQTQSDAPTSGDENDTGPETMTESPPSGAQSHITSRISRTPAQPAAATAAPAESAWPRATAQHPAAHEPGATSPQHRSSHPEPAPAQPTTPKPRS
jgi:moderate conductance mechanosensitive channel